MKTVLVIAAVMFLFAGQAQAVTLVTQQDTFDYASLTTDLWSNWGAAGYGSFNWGSAQWTAGQAAFGNGGEATYWAANSDMALTKTITINGQVTSATYYAGVDNGFILFINGQQAAKANAEGSWSRWEYSGSIPGSFFHPGQNTVQVLLEDHGGGTGFDMKIEADVRPVPLPAALLLFAPGLAGLMAARRRKVL